MPISRQHGLPCNTDPPKGVNIHYCRCRCRFVASTTCAAVVCHASVLPSPEQMIAPQIEAMAAEYEGRMIMTKIDCGAYEKSFAQRNGIKALPTFQVARGTQSLM